MTHALSRRRCPCTLSGRWKTEAADVPDDFWPTLVAGCESLRRHPPDPNRSFVTVSFWEPRHLAGKAYPQAKHRVRNLAMVHTTLNPIPDSIRPMFEALLAMPYFARRLGIRKHLKPPPARFLYKFRASPSDPSPAARDQYVSRMRQIMVDSELWLSSPSDFNDPFDTMGRFEIKGTTAKRSAHIRALVEKYAPMDATPIAIQQAYDRLAGVTDSEILRMLRPSFEKQRDSTGVICFVEGDPRDVLMWSHYAANHKGVCLQFETARDLFTFGRALTVKYVRHYPVVNWLKGKYEMERILRQKHPRWKYEVERRIIQIGAARSVFKYNPSALVGLVFGCAADDTVTKATEEVLTARANAGLPALKLYRAEKHESRYELVIKAL